MGIHLPDHVTYTSARSKPMGSPGALVGDTATWANGGAIKAGKSKTYTANMQVCGALCLCLSLSVCVLMRCCPPLLSFTTLPSLFIPVARRSSFAPPSTLSMIGGRRRPDAGLRCKGRAHIVRRQQLQRGGTAVPRTCQGLQAGGPRRGWLVPNGRPARR